MAGRMVDRLVAALLQACCRQLWGFAPRMIPHIVASKGPFGALRWFAVNMPRYFRTMHVLGALRTHLSCMVISLYNGCIYCAYGHGYALELIYLRDRDRLFPLDASTLFGWLRLGPRELNERVRTVLQDAGMHGEAVWVDLTLDLLRGQQLPVDENEVRLAHLIEMLGAMNAIAVAASVWPDGAQNPINKNAAMKARNARLRAAAA